MIYMMMMIHTYLGCDTSFQVFYTHRPLHGAPPSSHHSLCRRKRLARSILLYYLNLRTISNNLNLRATPTVSTYSFLPRAKQRRRDRIRKRVPQMLPAALLYVLLRQHAGHPVCGVVKHLGVIQHHVQSLGGKVVHLSLHRVRLQRRRRQPCERVARGWGKRERERKRKRERKKSVVENAYIKVTSTTASKPKVAMCR